MSGSHRYIMLDVNGGCGVCIETVRGDGVQRAARSTPGCCRPTRTHGTSVSQFYTCKLGMWANAQRDGRPAEYRWRPLFNAAKFG